MTNLIPYPKVWEPKQGNFCISSSTVLRGDTEDAVPLVRLLQTLPEGEKNSLILKKLGEGKAESYRLQISDTQIFLSYADTAGLFYAVQTLRVLGECDVAGKAKYLVPAGIIEDEPRYHWRGLLLDESRHFFGKEAVKRLLERMAQVKMNVLHWHLTDDQGWRIELKSYPLLTEIGAKRKQTQVGGWQSDRYDGKPVDAFYTQKDIAEIIAYATARHIMVVPEVDMPGHFVAVLAAYPQLSCSGEAIEVATKFGVHKQIACGGKEEVYTFIADILTEIAGLFPAPYFHIGGDEAPKDFWEKCPLCQKKMQQLGLKNTQDLQGHLTNFAVGVLKANGKQTIGWNEVLEAGNLDPDFVVEYWTPTHDPRAVKYAKDGGKTIIAKYQSCYFDYTYAQHPLRLTYNFDKIMADMPLSAPNILGVEGAAWSEWIEDEKKLEFQVFPRLYALSEVAWSVTRPGFSHFLRRLKEFNRIADSMQIEYADLTVAEPTNILRRIARFITWGVCDQGQEFRLNKKVRKLK